jgi:hypothetical protein
MFCPVCKLEYRPGFTKCSDCDVDLVESLDASSGAMQQDPEVPSVLWTGTDSEADGAICRALDAAKISYHKLDRNAGLLPGLSEWVYAILVHERDRTAAQAVLDGVRRDYEIGKPTEGSDDGDLSSQEASEPQEEDENLEPEPDEPEEDFYPEDATSEVWAGEGAEMADYVRLCLRENRIGCVVDESNGKTHLRVLPASEARAREIVREIVEGTPLQ